MTDYTKMSIQELQEERTKIEKEISFRLDMALQKIREPGCNCRMGQQMNGGTGGWYCPVHGQMW